jgi:hypothetical protein
MQRLLIRLAASPAISPLCFRMTIAGAWIASRLEFRSFRTAVFAHVSLGAMWALITAIAAACIPSRIARTILLAGGALDMWSMLSLGLDRGYRPFGRHSPTRVTKRSTTAVPPWARSSSGGSHRRYGGSRPSASRC